MRLSNIENGHRLRHKLMLKTMKLVMHMDPPDVVRTLMYRPEFFGKRFGVLTQSTMRLGAEWSAGECELFSAFVSRKNQCPF